VADVDEDGRDEIVATLGAGVLSTAVAIDANCTTKTTYEPFQNFKKGVFVAGMRR
jgi:hypothetical protein